MHIMRFVLIGFLFGLVIGFFCGASTGVERVEVVTERLFVSEYTVRELKRENELCRRSLEGLRAERMTVDGYWEPVLILTESLVNSAIAVPIEYGVAHQEQFKDLIRAQARLQRLAYSMRGSPAGAPREVFKDLRIAQNALFSELEKSGVSRDELKLAISQAHERFNRAVRAYNTKLRAAELTGGFAPQLEIE